MFFSQRTSFPRKQQYRRLKRAGISGAGGLAALAAAAFAVSLGALLVAVAFTAVAGGCGLYARHYVHLASRAGVGARSENEVQRSLVALQHDGWRVRHSLLWGGGGDIDSVAIAPTGVAFAIETKTRNYTPEHLARVNRMAGWLRSRRRSWCRKSAVAVLCIVRARNVQRIEDGVLVVSIDRLNVSLREIAGGQY